MDKSAITMTADDDWWLERVTMDGEQRYPERIRVGSLDRPRVYVPERTCLWNGGCGLGVYSGPYDEDTGSYDLPSTIEAHHLTCGHTAYTEGEIPSYCPACGARVVKEEA